MNRSAAVQADPHFTPTPTPTREIDPQLKEDLRILIDARATLEVNKPLLAAARKAEKLELDARKIVGAHFDGPASLVFDGNTITIEPQTRGGGEVDHKAAWSAFYAELGAADPAGYWTRRMVEIAGENKTAPTPTAPKVSIVPESVPLPSAGPPVRMAARAH